MLRMSKLADYGTVVMTYLAQKPEAVHSAMEIANEVHVAVPTVSKVLKILAHENLVLSSRGARGGYVLGRSPKEISMAQIIDAMEGPIALTECSGETVVCEQEASCSIRGNWRKINQVVRDALQGVTLHDMAQPSVQPIHLYANGLKQRQAFV
jgi:FeS assembly SUF system regulator